jgi:hypothetical protein
MPRLSAVGISGLQAGEDVKLCPLIPIGAEGVPFHTSWDEAKCPCCWFPLLIPTLSRSAESRACNTSREYQWDLYCLRGEACVRLDGDRAW